MTLFGYGKTTAAIAKKFGNCKIYDDKFTSIQEFGSNKLLPMSCFNENNSKLEIVTPGIPPHHSVVKKAKNLISEYDLFANEMPFSIWISGTNGKTTVSKMLYFLLANKNICLGGNVGVPLADLDQNAKIWILETSSFTLHYTKKAIPNIYILLPVLDDHISWHGSFNEYKKAKLKPIFNMKEGELAIVPKEFKKELKSVSAFCVFYENSDDLANFFEIDIKKIKFQEPFLLDAILALSVEKTLFGRVDYKKINTFKIDPHRIEEVMDKQNRVWINDSKATNVSATLQALKNQAFIYPEKVILLQILLLTVMLELNWMVVQQTLM
jgi:UDP-N-acetylmuramoylalanine--D-glutamate ligase